MLWVDKYRPLALSKLDFHDELTERLQGLAKDGDLPHLMVGKLSFPSHFSAEHSVAQVYGPTGAGKKTRITALLREMFGPGVEKRRLGSCRVVSFSLI
jgi:replication factor C subunit 3/5